MCSFATRSNTEFNLAMLRFVGAQAGLLAPHPDLQIARDPRPPRAPAARGEPVGIPPNVGRQPFNLDACFTMVAALDLPQPIDTMPVLA